MGEAVPLVGGCVIRIKFDRTAVAAFGARPVMIGVRFGKPQCRVGFSQQRVQFDRFQRGFSLALRKASRGTNAP